jgi:hypothetical protein
MTCEHLKILFYEENLAFRCIECEEELVKLASITEFRLFCELSGIDPKTLIA